MRVSKDEVSMFRLVKKKDRRPVTLREHHSRRDRVLVKRRAGGFGDILMQRMMFEDMSKCFAGMQLDYCCPDSFIEFAMENPFCRTIRLKDAIDRNYGAVYDITTACRVHESKFGGDNSKHRSDIWAEHCGVVLERHEMHLPLNESLVKSANATLDEDNYECQPAVLLAPQSTLDDFGANKSLTDWQIKGLVSRLRGMGFWVYSVHSRHIDALTELGVKQFVNVTCDSWKYLTAAADYVISVDTGTFHLAGGIRAPLVGVFTFTDGKVYGKYYDFVLVQKHRDNGDWACGPCFVKDACPKSKAALKPCLTELSVDSIMEGFRKALVKWPSERSARKAEAARLPL